MKNTTTSAKGYEKHLALLCEVPLCERRHEADLDKQATTASFSAKVQIGNTIRLFNRCASSFISLDYEQEFELSMRNPGGSLF
jgi:hypothetical protein